MSKLKARVCDRCGDEYDIGFLDSEADTMCGLCKMEEKENA